METVHKLYVDVDETLVFWSNPDRPYEGQYTVNGELVSVLRKVIEAKSYDVYIWSGGGKVWADSISKKLFGDYNLKSYDKFATWWKLITEDDRAIDNRAQEERKYLEKFKRVFSPEEFIKEYK
jgi:hypothetical protein